MTEACKVAAHQFVRWFGWSVIPVHTVRELPDGRLTCSCRKGPGCPSMGKHPTENAWTTQAATSGADVEAFWEAMPDANVGIVTGAASGIWVLDVDTDKGGRESYEKLCYDPSGLPRLWQPMRTHHTGGGGFHRVFSLPDGVTVRSGKLAGYPGIDIRGEGGMIVAPPSRSGKGLYTAPADEDYTACPAAEWLLDMVREPPGAQGGPQRATGTFPAALAVDMAALPGRLLAAFSEIKNKGERSEWFHHLVALCKEAGLTQGEATTVLAEWCSLCEPPLYLGRVPQEVDRCWSKLAAKLDAYSVGVIDGYVPGGPGAQPGPTDGALALSDPVLAPEEPTEEPNGTQAPYDPEAWIPPVVEPNPHADKILDELYIEIDFEDMWEKVPPDPVWVWEPVIERKRTYSLTSAPKAGKSLLVLEAVGMICSGQRPPGASRARPPKHVAYVDAENTDFDVIDRLRDMGFKPDQLAGYLHHYPQVDIPALDTEDGAKAFVRQMKRLGVELVIIDTLARFVQGEEDKSQTVNDFYRHAVTPLKKCGIAVMRLDHSGWKDERVRGSSAKMGDVDAAYHLRWDKHNRVVTLTTVAQRGRNAPDELCFVRRSDPLRHELASAEVIVNVPGTESHLEAKALRLVGLMEEHGIRAEYRARNKVELELRKATGEKFAHDVFRRAYQIRTATQGDRNTEPSSQGLDEDE